MRKSTMVGMLLVVFIFMMGLVGCGGPDEETDVIAPDEIETVNEHATLLESALADFYAYRTEQGLATVESILKDEPDHTMALALRAAFNMQRDDGEAGFADANRALEIDPDLAFAHAVHSWYYEAFQGDLDFAQTEVDQAIALDPELAFTYDVLGNLKLYEGEYEEAIDDYKQATALEPEYLAAHTDMGWVYMELGELEAALEAFNRAIEINPDIDYVYSGRGDAYLYNDNYEAAMEDYTRAIELSDENPEYYLYRGYAYLYIEDYDLGLADFTRAIELGFEDADVYLDRAWIHSQTGDNPAAIADYESVIALDPEYTSAYNGAAYLIAIIDGDLDKALDYINTALTLEPGDENFLDTQAFIYYKMGAYENALQIFSALIENEYTYAYYGRGLVYEALGETENAVSDLQAFLDEYPDEIQSEDARQHLESLGE